LSASGTPRGDFRIFPAKSEDQPAVKKNGTGLGLAISKRIAQEHHGAIEVRSEIAQGLTFTLSLPMD
jgi:signal transduction histidine kinase